MAQFDALLKQSLDDLEQVSYEANKDRWVVWDNDPSKAQQIKQLHPHVPVFLFDPETKKYIRYYIEIVHRKPHMKNGQLIYDEEIIKI